MAKKNAEQLVKYYESVREHTVGMIAKTEEAMQNMKAFGDEFADVFEKTRKRHSSLLDKIGKRIEREVKKAADTAKAAVTANAAATSEKKPKAPATEAKPVTAKPAAPSKAKASKPKASKAAPSK